MSLEAALIEHSQLLRELLKHWAPPAAPSAFSPPPVETAPAALVAEEPPVVVEAASKPAPKPSAKPAATPPTAAVVPAAAPTTAPATEPAEVGYAQVRDAIVELAKTKGREAAAKLLADFGVAKGPDLQSKPETFASFIAAAKALLT